MTSMHSHCTQGGAAWWVTQSTSFGIEVCVCLCLRVLMHVCAVSSQWLMIYFLLRALQDNMAPEAPRGPLVERYSIFLALSDHISMHWVCCSIWIGLCCKTAYYFAQLSLLLKSTLPTIRTHPPIGLLLHTRHTHSSTLCPSPSPRPSAGLEL